MALPSVGCVGTGPFKFVEWVEGDHITVDSQRPTTGAARPTIDEIIWRVIPDDSARVPGPQGRRHPRPGDRPRAEDVAAAEADPELYVLARPALNTGYLAFNYKIAEFNDPNVRKAVAHAINRQGLVENFLRATMVKWRPTSCRRWSWGTTTTSRTGPTIRTCPSSSWLTPASPMG